jgi:hypothetical protein
MTYSFRGNTKYWFSSPKLVRRASEQCGRAFIVSGQQDRLLESAALWLIVDASALQT